VTAGLLIVGGGLAAQRCCEVLRAAGDDRPVTILAAERALPYDRPPLSKEVLHGSAADTCFRPAAWYRDNRIDVLLGRRAVALDTVRHEVTVADGERIGYDDLLIATGARARMLPGFERLPNVQVLRTREDAARLRAALAAGGPLAVIGAGLIGLEVAAAATRAGVPVTVVEQAPRAAPGVLGPRAGAWLTQMHRAAGVVVRTGATVVAAEEDELTLGDGTVVPYAHMVIGVGVTPNAEWAGRVRVDSAGRTGDARVYAAGDVTGAGHWEAAARGGAAVAARLLGRPQREPAPESFWSDQHGLRITCIGDPREASEVVAHGEIGDGPFELDHVRDGRTVAVLLAGRPPSALRSARRRLDTNPIPGRSAA
jgi:3-phenylpropionate/trans-cinnamate dioxygenase ferredoxin reductase subunit